MKAIIGLGNPGPVYSRNRHNVGYMVLERLAGHFGIKEWFYRHRSRVAKMAVAGEVVLLVQPQTYMNNSGLAVKSIVDSHRMQPGDVLVVYDDLDLSLGQLRLRPKGGSGGHRGIISIMEALDLECFHRLRLGIGSPNPGVEVVDHVLGNFTPGEWEIITDVMGIAVSAIDIWLKEGIAQAMSEFNGTFIGKGATDA